MKILILGGTRFLGRALVHAIEERGHTPVLLNRGQSSPDLFPHLEQIQADRTQDLSALKGRWWDAVVDTSGYLPADVHSSASLLSDATHHYTFISSLSVYADNSQPGVGEDGRLAVLENPATQEVTGETYGGLKALCEQAAERAMPGKVLTLRPGLIVGPYDNSDRFTYWPHRVAEGGEVLAPGRPERGVQFSDVRDIAEWNVKLIEAGTTGIYNVSSPAGMFDMGSVLETSRQVSGSDAHFTWVSDQFLVEQGAGPWMEVPLWLPESDPDAAGFFAFDVQKALDAGLTIRPLEDTVRATLEWDATRPDHPWRAGLSRQREAELLQQWHQQQG
jgi:2'-hydroxyisoflavone reductase